MVDLSVGGEQVGGQSYSSFLYNNSKDYCTLTCLSDFRLMPHLHPYDNELESRFWLKK